MAPAYQVFVVDMEGTIYEGAGPDGELANARVTRLEVELNAAGTATISLPTTDPDAALLTPGREVQIRRAGDVLFWGPIVRPQAGLRETTWQCAGLLWYFGRRFMGRADRANQLVNGDFEAGEDDWTFQNGVTHSIDTTPPAGGPGGDALLLEGGTADHTGHAKQIWTHPAGGYPTGDYLTGSVWVYIPSADYVGGAINDFGLVLRHLDADDNVVDVGIVNIDDDTPERDKWVALETGVANVKEGHTVEMLLFPPHGTAYYDLATLTFMESLSFGYPDTPADVTDIIEGIVDYAQDTAAGKSDLNIGFAGSATGVARQVAYQFEEHRNILDAMMEFVRDGVCDISVEVTTTTRTFTVWPAKKGSLYGTTLELDTNLADFTDSTDLEQAASSVILLGPGDGPDRPEGGAVDPTFVGGAFTAEIVEQAPDDASIGQLDQRAAERLTVAAHPEILEVTTLPGAGVIGNLTVGDTAPVVITVGWVDIDDTYRVGQMNINLDTDQATLTLNVVP